MRAAWDQAAVEGGSEVGPPQPAEEDEPRKRAAARVAS